VRKGADPFQSLSVGGARVKGKTVCGKNGRRRYW
jgi:hypothetical protein